MASLLGQILFDVQNHFANTNLNAYMFYGGRPVADQIQMLRNGLDIMVSTPAKVIDLLARRCLDVSHIQYLVIEDERSLEHSFGDDIRKILSLLPQNNLRVILLCNTITHEATTFAEVYLKPSVTFVNYIQQREQDPHFEICGQFNCKLLLLNVSIILIIL